MTKHIFWLASYPKSGNTLLRAILSSLFFTEDGVFNFKLLESITNFEDTYFVYKMKKFIGNDLNKLKNTTIFYKYLIKILLAVNADGVELLSLSRTSWVFFICAFILLGLLIKNLTDSKIFLALHFDWSSSGIISSFAAILIILANFTLTNVFTIM